MKDQQIKALKEELRVAKELLILSVIISILSHLYSVAFTFIFQNRSNTHTARGDGPPLDAGGDTDPATDPEELNTVVGMKRKAGLPGSAQK